MQQQRRMASWILTASLVLVALFIVDGARLKAFAEENMYNLGEVVVSAADSGIEAVGTTVSVDAETIKQRGVRNLNEALTLVPGVNIRTGNDGTPRIDIRGYRTRHVLLLLDGIPMNSTYDGQFDPASIPVEHIAEIKLTTGASSVLYGAGGNGGVINIITKKGENGLHGSTVAEVSQEDAYLGRVSLGGSDEKIDGFISGSFSSRNGFRMSNDFVATSEENGDERGNSDRQTENVFANFGYSLSDNTMLGLSFNYQGGEYGKPVVTNYDKNDPFTKKPKYERLDDQEGFASQLAFEHRTRGPLSLRGWAFFNTLDVEENRYDDATYSSQVKKGSYGTTTTTDIYGGSVQAGYDLQQKGNLTLGLSGQREAWKADGFEMTKDNVSSAIDSDEDLQVYSAAVEYSVAPLDKLELVVGFGQHYQDREGEDEDAYSYLLGLHYDLFETTRLKAAHARKVRFPSIKQLYDVNGGNAALQAERTMHYEIGLEQQLPAATTLRVTLYHNDAEDFIEKDSSDINQNFENYRFRGLEIVVENRAIDNLVLQAGYSYLDSEDLSSNSQKDELQYRPRDKFTIEATYDFSFGLTANASLLYIDNQYFYDADGTDPLLKQELPSYTIVNLKLEQDLFDKALSLYAGADNLFDEEYEQSYGLSQPGRTLYAGVEYRF